MKKKKGEFHERRLPLFGQIEEADLNNNSRIIPFSFFFFEMRVVAM